MSERLQPAFWGGLFIGVLSALPFINLGNCCCCLWVVSGGVLAAYLRQQQLLFAMAASEGALVGLMAGIIGGLLGSVLSIPMHFVTQPFEGWMLEWIRNNPDLPSELRAAFEQWAEQPRFGPVAFIISTCTNVVVGLIFGMLGGLLGVAIFKKNAPPPPPPPGPLPPPLPPSPPSATADIPLPPPQA
jgi:hypothetical protein